MVFDFQGIYLMKDPWDERYIYLVDEWHRFMGSM